MERLVSPGLSNLARSFGDAAHVFVPANNDRGSIKQEINDWLHRRKFGEIELPGILVLDHAMGDEQSYQGEARFVSFATLLSDPTKVDLLLTEVKEAFTEVYGELR